MTILSRYNRTRNGLTLSISARVGKAFVPFVRRHLQSAHALLGRRTSLTELSLALVGDQTMSRLHEQFMQIPGPTDVLTFPLELSQRGQAISGEIVIDVAEAVRRAKEHHVNPRLEVLLYAVHGLLHLSGHDDRTKRGFTAMHRLEDELLTKLGLGPVFSREIAGRRR
jgi:probable rRNA maturation factor